MDAIHLPNAITLPTTFGAPGTPLPVGHVVQALVLELIESDVFRLQLPQAVVDVRTDVPLAPGSTVTIVPKGSGANTRLTIYADDPQLAGSAAPSSTAPAAPSLAGKHPVGEATIIARVGANAPVAAAPSGAAPAAAPKAAPTAVAASTIHAAPSLSPAPAPAAPAPRNPTPPQALGEAVRVAAARQSGAAPLFADIAQVLQLPDDAMPAAVRAAARAVLALRLPLDGKLAAADVKQAFVRSGVLLEPRLAADARATPRPTSAPAPATPAPANDLKAALIVFRQVLKAWASETTPVRSADPAPAVPLQGETARPTATSAASIRHVVEALAGEAALPPPDEPLSPEQAARLAKSVAAALSGREAPAEHLPPPGRSSPPPPYRGAPLAAQQPVAASITPDTPPHETAERLLGATEGALARTTLLQAASLPDQPNAPRTDPTQRWTFEVPLATPQGTGVAQFEVSRDGRTPRHEDRAAVWRARFSLDLEPMGPVHALIALAGERASVTLWAERAATATRLNEQSTMLGDALRAAALEPADFQFRVGAPPAVARQAAPGRFMDRAT